MEPRKNPKYDLKQYRALFFNIGLAITMLLVLVAFEWKFYDDTDILKLNSSGIEFVEALDVPISEQPPPPPPKVLKNIKIIAVEDIEDIEDEIEIDLDIDITEDLVIEEIIEMGEEDLAEEDYDEIFVIVEESPTPVGGIAAFYKYVNDNISYPGLAQSMRIEGKVFVQFVVDKDGSLTNIEVIRGIGSGCDEEALRVIKNTPAWNPGKQRGKAVRVKMILPITFKIM